MPRHSPAITDVLQLNNFASQFRHRRRPHPTCALAHHQRRTLAKLDDGKHIHYLDIGGKFLQPDGSLTKGISPDFLHLSAAGYQIWADAIAPSLATLMK